MLPVNIDITPKGYQASICLREIYLLAGLGVEESELASGPKRYADGDILVSGPLWVECGGVVVKWLPVGTVPVPIEASSDALKLDTKVLGNASLNFFVCFGAFWIAADEMRPLMPANPL